MIATSTAITSVAPVCGAAAVTEGRVAEAEEPSRRCVPASPP